MRWLRLAAPAALLAAWLAGSVAQQQGTPPAGTPPASTPQPSTPQPSTPRPPAPPEREQEDAAPPAAGDDAEDVFVPTEELQPDAAVTFPVDI
jgi:hypothetical protein